MANTANAIRKRFSRGAATYTQGRPPVPRRSSGPMTAPRLVANNRAKPPISRMEIMSVPQL